MRRSTTPLRSRDAWIRAIQLMSGRRRLKKPRGHSGIRITSSKRWSEGRDLDEGLEVDAGGQRFELSDALLQIRHLDQLAGRAAALARDAASGKLEPLDVEPALPAAKPGEGGDAEAGQAEACQGQHDRRVAHLFLPEQMKLLILSAAPRSRGRACCSSW